MSSPHPYYMLCHLLLIMQVVCYVHTASVLHAVSFAVNYAGSLLCPHSNRPWPIDSCPSLPSFEVNFKAIFARCDIT